MQTIVTLPTLHADQVKAFEITRRNRFAAIRCGRRWGKTVFAETLGSDYAIKGRHVGWFAPEFKFLTESYRDIEDILDPVWASSRADTVYRTKTDGSLTFWSLDNDRAGRGRKYHLIIIDEAGFTKVNMLDIWRKNLRPTLVDYRGRAIALSNTNGVGEDNFLWQICNQKEHGFVEYHAPTHSNPLLPPDEIEELERTNHPMVYKQEYLAEFVDWSGVQFFALANLLVNEMPVDLPGPVAGVFATIDTAVKTGREHDGTGVVFWAVVETPKGKILYLLDYDLIQIEGALLEAWLPTIFQRLEEFSRGLNARAGSLGAWIEDKASGSVLLQQARRRNWQAHEIDSKLTALGKAERAISISGYVFRGIVKICRAAFERTIVYKGISRNHLVSQILGFRVGVKDQVDDDLLDAFCYGVALAMGNSEGF